VIITMKLFVSQVFLCLSQHGNVLAFNGSCEQINNSKPQYIDSFIIIKRVLLFNFNLWERKIVARAGVLGTNYSFYL